TERKQAEEALRQTEQRYRSFVEASAQVVWTTNARGEVNLEIPAWYAYTGQNAAQARAFGWMEAIHPEDRQRVTTAWARAFASRGIYEVNYRLRRHDGAWRYILARGVPVFESAGIVREYVGTCIDMTERKAAEDALRKSEARLNGIISSAMDAIISINTEQRVVLFNAAAERMFATRTADALGKHITHFIPARFREAHVHQVESFGRSGVTSRSMGHLGALSAQRANGEEFPIEASISQIELEGEKLFTVILRDISARIRAEEALRASEQRFRQLADAMPQIVWAARPDGSLDYYNRKWYELTGGKPGENGDESWLPVLHPEERQRCLDVWYESVRTGQPYEIEYRFKFPGAGEYRWHLGRALPVRNEQGDIVRWFGTSTDIHELKRTEAALSEARNGLERTVAERTAQLVEANTNLQTFAYTAAHDLRSPLRAIKSFSSIAIEECAQQLSPDGRSYLERVLRSADQMERLLADLLEYSKLSQAEISLANIDLANAVSEALRLQEPEIRARNAEIQVADAMPSVVGHPATVALIIANFISNALKFTAAEVQPRLRLWAEGCGAFVRFSVEDNGIGIAPEDRGKLFGVFQRLHGKQAYPGTGLGLAIVRKGAERMGGRVGVESELGKGSRFWVELKGADGAS
ncbi:MAG TPA: PAS domain S-box protein, partial [Bacillota bacterium]|nr:PAS domain S-box protein [Bacillota bacterium]